MTSQTVYKTDDNGIFLGATKAFESPLEPGVFLLPKNSYSDSPPSFASDQYAKREGGSWVVYDKPDDVATVPEPEVLSLEESQAQALAKIDDTVGSFRLLFITDIPGQQMIYKDKEDEARAFLALDPAPTDLTDYPYISAESVALGFTPTEVAETYEELSSLWRTTSVAMETVRIKFKGLVSEATTVEDVDSLITQFMAALEQ